MSETVQALEGENTIANREVTETIDYNGKAAEISLWVERSLPCLEYHA